MFNGERYREGTPAPLLSDVPTPAMKNGDFSGLVDAQGRLIRSTTPRPDAMSTASGRGIRSEQPHSRPPHQPGGPGDRAVFPGSESHDGWRGPVAGQPGFFRALQQGRVLELGRESRSQFQFERSLVFRWGENERNEIRNTSAIRTGPAGRAVAAHSRQPRHRRRLGPHLRFEHRAELLRSSYTYYLELSRSDAALGFDPSEFGWPSPCLAAPSAARLGGMFPRIDIDQFEQLSRGTNPRTNQIYAPAERVDDPRKAQPARRHGHPADQRLPGRLRERRRRRSR